jgi:hypothetical protein
MPPNLISARLLICEKILVEMDGVLSAIRLVDVFYFSAPPEIPREQIVVPMFILATGYFLSPDDSKHSLELRLIRPDGESTAFFTQNDVVAALPGIAGVPRGFSVVASVSVAAKQIGTHYVSAVLDGEEVARGAFTLLEQPQKPVG